VKLFEMISSPTLTPMTVLRQVDFRLARSRLRATLMISWRSAFNTLKARIVCRIDQILRDRLDLLFPPHPMSF
jgi:hypothetical protein